MDRQTRDKFVARTNASLTSGNSCLETPPAIFKKLYQDFGPFTIDLTADKGRTLCPVWFGPESPYGVDALTTHWIEHGLNGYSNPPYGPFVGYMLDKAKREAKHGFTTTLLLPVRITKAFHQHVMCGASELWFCDKRIAFWENGKPKLDPETMKPTGALFDSMIVRYLPGQRFSAPRLGTWKVPPHSKYINGVNLTNYVGI